MVGAFYIPEGPFTRGTVKIIKFCLVNPNFITDFLGSSCDSGIYLVENTDSVLLLNNVMVIN